MYNRSLGETENFKVNTRSKTISAILPWIQIMHIYAFISGVTLGYLMIILVDIAIVMRQFGLKSNTKLRICKKDSLILVIFFYMFVALCVIAVSGYTLMPVSILNRLLKMICIFFLIIECNDSLIDWEIYKNNLRILTYIVCFVLLVQFCLHLFTGRYYNFNIPFLRFANEATEERLTGVSTSSRFRSVFSEPSHFVYFVFQYLCIVLFDKEELSWKRIKEALFISLCVLLSISSTGIILLIVVWFLFILNIWRSGKVSTSKFGMMLLLILLLTVAVIYVISNEHLSFSIYRLSGSYERSNIVWKRLYANMDDVRLMSGIFRFTGYGVGNIKSEFMNSFVYSLLNFGYIGLFLICAWLISMFLYCDKCGKITLLVFVLLMAIDMVFYTPTLLGYMIIIRKHFKTNLVSLEESQ